MLAVLQLLKHVKGLQETGKFQYLNSKYNSETLSRKECFNALTIYPALAFGDDQILGTLEAGKKGTFVIFNDNPNETTKEKLKNITVKNTFIDGVKIY